MSTKDDPDDIRADIEQTRAELSYNVDTLTETANPKNIAERQVDKIKGAAQSVRDHVIGAPDDPADSGRLGDATHAVGDRAAELKQRAAATGDAVADAPQRIRRKARGNPMAAGLIAFGIGYLISSAIPSTAREQLAAQRLQERSEPLMGALSDTAHELGDRLREPAKEAAESVRATVGEAVTAVKQEGAAAKDEVQEQVQSSGDAVRGSAS